MALSRIGMFPACILGLRIGREIPQVSNIMLILCSSTPCQLTCGLTEWGWI